MPGPRPAADLRLRTAPWLTAFALALVPSGCHSDPQPTKSAATAVMSKDQVDPVALQGDVNAFAFTFRSQIAGAVTDMSHATSARTTREALMRWRIAVVPAIDTARRADDPRVALTGVWAICIRQRTLFDGEFGEQNFGDQVEAARTLARSLEAQIVEIAERYLPPQRIAEASKALEEIASDAPIIAGIDIVAKATKRSQGGSDPISQVLSIPLSPFSAVGAIGDTPQEIRNFTNVTARIGETVHDLPERIRWQTELFLLETESHPAVAAADRVSTAAESFAETASSLQQSIENTDGPITQVRQTVLDAQALAATVDQSVARAEGVIASIDGHAEELSRTAAAFESTVVAAQSLLETWLAANPPKPPPAPGDPPQPESPPFDIKDATAAAEKARAAIEEARGLLTDIQSTDLTARLDEVTAASTASIDHAAARLDQAIGRLVWSLAAIIALGIVAWAIARIIVIKLTRPA